MAIVPSSAALQQARQTLKQNGVNPESLSKEQLYAFASRTPDAQRHSIDVLLKHLNIDSEDSDDESSTAAAAEDLLTRCNVLVDELEQFAEYLKEHNKERPVEYRTFRNELKSEVRFLQRLQGSDIGKDKIRHNISSSNLPYYEAVWAAAKRSSEILTFRKWFYWEKPSPATTSSDDASKTNAKAETPPNKARKQHSALVDCVARNGREWIKVSTITENRILMELAKQGWQNDSDSDEDMDNDSDDEEPHTHRPDPANDSSDEDEVSLLRIAKDLSRASKTNRVHTHRPHITFVLPRVHAGKYTQVDRILTQIASTGATVLCASDIPSPRPITTALPALIVDETRDFTSTLNIDCTILLALVSDISHQPVEPQPWFPRAVRQQIDVERTANLLPSTLYPLMARRALTCTAEAAQRMREIVATIGTDTEKARAEVFVAEAEAEGAGARQGVEALEKLRALTTHALPADLKVPIIILPAFALPDTLPSLPSLAAGLAETLSPINQAVFLSGWARGVTTLSSNAAVARQIEREIEERRGDGEEDVTGPLVWVCVQSRSLVSKAGRGDGRWGSFEERSVVREVIS